VRALGRHDVDRAVRESLRASWSLEPATPPRTMVATVPGALSPRRPEIDAVAVDIARSERARDSDRERIDDGR